jgi:peptidoglycan/xylan/chitin deacetylase (PgdA/CDA1 family)
VQPPALEQTAPVPIVCYHRIAPRDSVQDPFAITPEVLEQHLDLLVRRGVTTVTVSELVNMFAAGASTTRVAALTFDDGFSDMHSVVLPLLRERGMTATSFVITSCIAEHDGTGTTCPHLTRGQLSELAEAGVEIGCHSATHAQLDLATPETLLDEIVESRATLQAAIDREVTSFAYPYGYSSPLAREIAKSAGYHGACGVRHGFSSHADDPFDLTRLRLTRRTSMQTVERWIDGQGAKVSPKSERFVTRAYRPVRRARERVRRVVEARARRRTARRRDAEPQELSG